MGLLAKLSIGKKLGLGFGFVLTLTALLAILSIIEIGRINGNTLDLATNWLPSVKILGKIAFDTSVARRSELTYLLAEDESSRATSAERAAAAAEAINKDIEAYEPLISSDEERRIYGEWKGDWGKYSDLSRQVLRIAKEGKTAKAVNLANSTGYAAFTAFYNELNEDVELNDKGAAGSTAEAARTYSAAKYWIVGLSICALSLGIVLSVALARALAASSTKMLATIEQIAANHLAIADMEITSADEIGKAGLALNKMKNNLHQVIESIAGTAQHVASASEEFSATSQQITASSEEATAQANNVSSAAEQINRNLQTVATGAEEMSVTIKDIAKNAGEAAKVAGEAVKTAETTNMIVSKLGDSSAEIGQVIKVITSIAQQTNLLALNATIEAARAGEAGKGFAVVANEVKELAKQTAKATEDISRKILAIQEDTKGAVGAIGSIGSVIGHINDISTTIAAAVEQQSATTNEMSRNVMEAAKGSESISHTIGTVAQAAQNTSSSAQDSQKAASQLAEMSTGLRVLVERFKIDANGQGGSFSRKHAA